MKWILSAGEYRYPLDACLGDLMVLLCRIQHQVTRNEFPYVQRLGQIWEKIPETSSKTFPSFPDEDY
ncbi:hypothetical protein L195_g009865 [Trifolium pratense]|uniref:Uncharacterized protein n=1 Tax=Trifolium pratense TaxID=57577 RepID=A0A2K3MTL5_TRIPR|nr:hypothetical protein L195_g016584 [Trifolium pratense]PNX94168.1 hypothetical protein L195_g017338 [Trifolium pratense]PNY13216.1 hypothetical protein L195_g009865 [Trifolium pratense]